MIVHDRISAEANAEERRQHPDPVLDPSAAMLVALAGVSIDTLQESPPDTMGGDMVVARARQGNQVFAGPGHVSKRM